jgi:hypothetical protein
MFIPYSTISQPNKKLGSTHPLNQISTKHARGWSHPQNEGWNQPNPIGPGTKQTVRVSLVQDSERIEPFRPAFRYIMERLVGGIFSKILGLAGSKKSRTSSSHLEGHPLRHTTRCGCWLPLAGATTRPLPLHHRSSSELPSLVRGAAH